LTAAGNCATSTANILATERFNAALIAGCEGTAQLVSLGRGERSSGLFRDAKGERIKSPYEFVKELRAPIAWPVVSLSDLRS
jgi:hypothetical protein